MPLYSAHSLQSHALLPRLRLYAAPVALARVCDASLQQNISTHWSWNVGGCVHMLQNSADISYFARPHLPFTFLPHGVFSEVFTPFSRAVVITHMSLKALVELD